MYYNIILIRDRRRGNNDFNIIYIRQETARARVSPGAPRYNNIYIIILYYIGSPSIPYESGSTKGLSTRQVDSIHHRRRRRRNIIVGTDVLCPPKRRAVHEWTTLKSISLLPRAHNTTLYCMSKPACQSIVRGAERDRRSVDGADLKA